MKAYPVTVLCKVMRVSRSGFYKYLKHIDQGLENDPGEAALKVRIQAIFKAHRSKYGYRGIMKALNDQGHSGCLISQDTFYVGYLKGVGRID